jgi:hypothetical protein
MNPGVCAPSMNDVIRDTLFPGLPMIIFCLLPWRMKRQLQLLLGKRLLPATMTLWLIEAQMWLVVLLLLSSLLALVRPTLWMTHQQRQRPSRTDSFGSSLRQRTVQLNCLSFQPFLPLALAAYSVWYEVNARATSTQHTHARLVVSLSHTHFPLVWQCIGSRHTGGSVCAPPLWL